MITKKVIIAGCMMLVFFLGCSGLTPQQQRILSGGAMGAGAGAAIGAISGGSIGTAAAVGGAVGAVGGAVVHELKKK